METWKHHLYTEDFCSMPPLITGEFSPAVDRGWPGIVPALARPTTSTPKQRNSSFGLAGWSDGRCDEMRLEPVVPGCSIAIYTMHCYTRISQRVCKIGGAKTQWFSLYQVHIYILYIYIGISKLYPSQNNITILPPYYHHKVLGFCYNVALLVS